MICGAVPAAVVVDPPASSVHVPPLATPTPTPISMFDGGEAAVSVTSISPVCVTLKLWESLPRGFTVPVKVSVFTVTDGLVELELELPPPQLATAIAHTPDAAR